jgi:hypothetical protein
VKRATTFDLKLLLFIYLFIFFIVFYYATVYVYVCVHVCVHVNIFYFFMFTMVTFSLDSMYVDRRGTARAKQKVKSRMIN